MSVDFSQSGCGLGPTSLSVQTMAGAAPSSADMGSQLQDLVNSPEAAAVGQAVTQEAAKNPMAVAAGVGTLLLGKGLLWAGLAYAAAAYLLKPKVDVALTPAGAAIVVPPAVAQTAASIASSAGANVDIAAQVPASVDPSQLQMQPMTAPAMAGYGNSMVRQFYNGFGVLVGQSPVGRPPARFRRI